MEFVGCKERNRERAKLSGYIGDAWAYIGMCADSKLILAHEVGRRTADTTDRFLTKLRIAIAGRVQITTDGFNQYKYAIPFKFRNDADYAMLIKNYANSQTEKRYSPASIINSEKIAQFGNPDMDHVSTSYSERLNLTVRTGLRRFTRLALGFSKSIEMHEAMLIIWICKYNFGTVHSTVKTTPAIAARITAKKWTLREVAKAIGN